jgi:DNA repair protein RecN (Recombination protein N)
LERKHGRDLPGLIELRNELKEKLSDLSDLEVRTGDAEEELDRAIDVLKRAATALSRKRKSGARELERQVRAELADLDLKGAGLRTDLIPHEARPAPSGTGEGGGGEVLRLLPSRLRASGAETFELLFSANPEQPVRPLAECASGGELSRVMLALKGVLARAGGADRLPVVVFDEIDSGVGGRLGAVLGRKLAGLAEVRQVLCVTHLPQLAVYAQRQIKVEKTHRGETTSVAVTPVEGAERVEELSLMLRGDRASGHTREEAAEMLRAAQAEGQGKGKRKAAARRK